MTTFHQATFDLLRTRPRTSAPALGELQDTEKRLGIRLPASVREWYSDDRALAILAEHSNDDPPIPVRKFALTGSVSGPLIPFRWENQGVCVWAILIDGSDDPPVLVDVDSNGTDWQPYAGTFSTYVYTCVWDYQGVLTRPAIVSAQNAPLSPEALEALRVLFEERPTTRGWPGSVQYRFEGDRYGVLLWSAKEQADWFVGAADAISLESALRRVWTIDRVGDSFYDCTEIAAPVLARMNAGK